MKFILQVADCGPLESLVHMLIKTGHTCFLPNRRLRDTLRNIGCDTVLDPEQLSRQFGYDLPQPLPEVGPDAMSDPETVYVDVKAHRCYERVVEHWPNLKDRVLWYRINGGEPEHVINDRGDHGNEVDPPCPVLTPNRWYAEPGPWSWKSYSFWPYFVRHSDYDKPRPEEYSKPICLIHNLQGWGYDRLIDPLRERGVRLYGTGSPDGLVRHSEVPGLLNRALCMVHLKSSDAPGYALLEAMAAGCPIVCTRRLIWRCRMQELLIPGQTCLVFDRETHDGLSEDDVRRCTKEIDAHLSALKDVRFNQQIGEAGRERLLQLMWGRDANSVTELDVFLNRHFHQEQHDESTF